MSEKLISIAMIVKNEEMLLPRALANLSSLADEIIVVDTGSEDRTVEIAERIGATVLRYHWQAPGHKSEARNMGIDMATGKWIVVLDADEEIQKPAELREYLTTCPAHGVHVQFYNVEPDNHVSLVWNQMRAFRRGLYRYQYREHEIPIAVQDGLTEIVTDFVFLHRQPPERKATKTGAMLERLKQDVIENPDDPHPWYFLTRQYAIIGDWDKAIQAGKQFLRLADGKDKAECYGILATCHENQDDPYRALLYLHRVLAEQPHRRIWWSRIAELYVQAGQWNTALGYLRGGLEIWQQAEQHYQPDAQVHMWQLIDRCQAEIAHAATTHGEHSHGG